MRNLWLDIYNEVKFLSQCIKYGSVDNDGNEPVVRMSHKEKKEIRNRITLLLEKSNLYLDSINLRPKPALWLFSIDDPRTWASYKDFAYRDKYGNEEKMA